MSDGRMSASLGKLRMGAILLQQERPRYYVLNR